MRAIFVVAALGLALGGCFRTTEMQTSANTFQISTDAGGFLYAGRAGQENLRKAAELTLAKGYTHFRMEGASLTHGSQYIGHTPGTVNVVGNTAFVNPGVAMRGPTAQASATVIMYRAGDPGFAGSLDAAAILRQAQS